ncbi:MAG: hypothetical protein JO292_02630, partial [Betaproteobacteria bacterium]|nr:hypothetical protein [Betaproteobacteria bacterium]MBV9360263.1 hypothetical protein [Betaproteobacteria bacterium]
MHQHAPIEVADLAWAFASLCNVLRVPFDSRLFLQRFPPPATVATITLAAAALGLRSRVRTLVPAERTTESAPCIALRRTPDGGVGVAVVLCADHDKLLVAQRAREAYSMGFREFAQAFEPEVLEIEVPATAPTEPAEIATRPFGLWAFVPELLRHRAVWRDVLAASAAMQLI